MGPMGNAIRAVPSHPMGHFPWDSHGNPIPMDKPAKFTIFIRSSLTDCVSDVARYLKKGGELKVQKQTNKSGIFQSLGHI